MTTESYTYTGTGTETYLPIDSDIFLLLQSTMDVNGSSFRDYSPNAFPLTIIGSPEYNSKYFGDWDLAYLMDVPNADLIETNPMFKRAINSLIFNDAIGYIEAPEFQVEDGQDFTISFWIRPDMAIMDGKVIMGTGDYRYYNDEGGWGVSFKRYFQHNGIDSDIFIVFETFGHADGCVSCRWDTANFRTSTHKMNMTTYAISENALWHFVKIQRSAGLITMTVDDHEDTASYGATFNCPPHVNDYTGAISSSSTFPATCIGTGSGNFPSFNGGLELICLRHDAFNYDNEAELIVEPSDKTLLLIHSMPQEGSQFFVNVANPRTQFLLQNAGLDNGDVLYPKHTISGPTKFGSAIEFAPADALPTNCRKLILQHPALLPIDYNLNGCGMYESLVIDFFINWRTGFVLSPVMGTKGHFPPDNVPVPNGPTDTFSPGWIVNIENIEAVNTALGVPAVRFSFCHSDSDVHAYTDVIASQFMYDADWSGWHHIMIKRDGITGISFVGIDGKIYQDPLNPEIPIVSYTEGIAYVKHHDHEAIPEQNNLSLNYGRRVLTFVADPVNGDHYDSQYQSMPCRMANIRISRRRTLFPNPDLSLVTYPVPTAPYLPCPVWGQ